MYFRSTLIVSRTLKVYKSITAYGKRICICIREYDVKKSRTRLLEKREFYTDQRTNVERIGKLKGFNAEDLLLIKEKFDEIILFLKYKPGYDVAQSIPDDIADAIEEKNDIKMKNTIKNDTEDIENSESSE